VLATYLAKWIMLQHFWGSSKQAEWEFRPLFGNPHLLVPVKAII